MLLQKQDIRESESLATSIESVLKRHPIIPEVESDVNHQVVEITRGKTGQKISMHTCERGHLAQAECCNLHRTSLKFEAVDRLVFLAHNLK